MKVWLLTTEYPPFFGGGISTYCKYTSSMLSKEGAVITVFLSDRNCNGISVTIEDGIRVVRFSPFEYQEKKFLGHETLTSFAFSRVIRSFILKEGRPDIIESQEYNGIAYFILLYKKLLYPEFQKLVIVITIHAPSFVCQPFNRASSYSLPYFWIHEMEKFCLQAANHIIAPGNYIIDLIKKECPQLKNQFSVIRNPFKESGKTDKTSVLKKEFVFYGKASPLKGIFELLQYFIILWKKDPEIKLRLIGGMDHFYHPDQTLMGNLIRKKYSDYIRSGQLIIEGSIKPYELNNKLGTARAVIMPSLVDNFPYAVLECMSAEKVVLASTSGGHREIINDGVNGFLFDVENQQDFLKKTDVILGLDDASLEKIGQAAKMTVRTFCDPESIGRQKLSLFERLLSLAIPGNHFPFLRQVPQTSAPSQVPEQTPGLLSVIVPFYNMGDYVEETIQSILRSDYQQIEIIVVNDGSDDAASIQALERVCSGNRVKVFHTANNGLARARNYGAMEAKGEFMAFLDPDDTVEPSYYKKALQLLQHYDNLFFVGSWVKYFGERTAIWPCFTPEPPFLLVHNMANTSSLVYKRHAFLHKGSNDPAMIFGMEDYESMISMVSYGYNGVIIPEPLFNYRVRKDSMARQFTKEKMVYLYEVIAAKHAAFYACHADQIAGLLNANGPGYAYDNPTLDYHIRNNKLINLLLSSKTIQRVKQNRYLRKPLLLLYSFLKKT